MVSAATKIARRELGVDWLDSSDAARALGTTPKHLTDRIRPLITHQSRSLAGRGARHVGYAYAREDVERVNAIKQALGATTLEAAKILQGIRRLGHLGMLARIEAQLDLSIDKQRKRRRFQ